MNTEELSIAEWEGISCCHPVSCQEMEAFLEGIVDKQQTLQVPVSAARGLSCLRCNKVFSRMDSLKRHMRYMLKGSSVNALPVLKSSIVEIRKHNTKLLVVGWKQ